MYISVYIHEPIHIHMYVFFHYFLSTLSWQLHLILTTSLQDRYDFPLIGKQAQKDDKMW